MLLPRPVVWILPLGMMILGMDVASGQDWPNKPIRIVTAEPGGNTDLVTRTIADALDLNQPVVTHNRPSGVVAAETVINAPPDGYTLLLQSSSFWVGPLVQKLSYDAARDFEAITLATNAPFFLYVNPSVPAKSVKELIALAKARPGELNYGSSAAGSSNHLATELFKHMAAVNIVRVAYKGAEAAGIGLMSNEVQVMFGSALFGMPHVKAGRLRVLAVADDRPSALAPNLPTITASGVPGYEASGMSGVWAPAKTPRPLVNRINRELVRALNKPGTKEKFLNVGLETVGSSPEQAASYIKSDIAKWSKLIRDAGILGK